MTSGHLPTALLAFALLAGCGSATGVGTAADPAASASPTASPTASPSAPPTVGTYPAYPHDDYTFVLGLRCFCPVFRNAIRVTVTGGEVSAAVWARTSPGLVEGEPVPYDWARLTIDDVIDAANDTTADDIAVDWPEGSDHPTKVAVDPDLRAIDEEITYLVSDVQAEG